MTNSDAVSVDEDEIDDRPHGFFRYVCNRIKGVVMIVFLCGCVLAGGFLSFALDVASLEPPEKVSADGIVVLTGGAERVETALGLLMEKKADRLLISGVAPRITAADIAATYPNYSSLFDCCVDLDRGAENTIGNGTQSGRWARDNSFRSLLVVTSSYHMPRAMAEVSDAAREIRLIPYPVVREELNLGRWYQNRETAGFLGREYLKYLLALARINIKHIESHVSDMMTR